MSVSAGRVLIIPCGAYVAGTTYHMLDLVTHENGVYIAKQTSTNVAPVDGAYWMLLMSTTQGVATFNGRTGAVVPAQDDYLIGQIKATGTLGQVVMLNANGKLELGDAITSFKTRTGAVVPTRGDYTGDMIPLTGYTKPQATSAITSSDDATSALGKLEVKADSVIGQFEAHDFTITTTDWVTNDNTRNSDTYTVKQVISTTAFANTPSDAQLDCILLSATADSVMTEAEKEDAYKLSSDVTIGATSITVYAEEATTNALRLRVKGV